ncbi:MAG: DNA primase [Candidatus Krumholzibacteriia bacterium]
MVSERRGRVPGDVVERVREATDIIELIGQYVNLKRSGRSFKGLCPFHTEKTPSFMVGPERQMFYCFGCQKGGDAFTFVMEHDGISFVEALRALGDRVGIAVETRPERGRAHDDLYAAAEAAARVFPETLAGPEGEPARRYLAQREVSRETAERFRLGAAPDRWDALGRALDAQGVAQGTLLGLGLVAPRREAPGTYDTFRNRLVFPIQSLSARVVGFGGRILPGPDAERAPKYVNSQDSPIYHKNRVLYGLAEARGAIRRRDAAILTEGYVDFLSLHQAGIEHVVAACGTAFAPQQAALLHRYTHRAYILGDSDPAGRRAAVRTAGLLLEHGFLVHVVELPAGYDPDTFVREYGAAAMQTRVREAPGYIAYMKLLVDRRAGDLAVKERVVQHLLDDLGRLSDPLLQELYTKELCRSFALSEATVVAALDKRRAPRPAAETSGSHPALGSTVPVAVREARRGLLRLGLASRVWVEKLVAEFEPADFDRGAERRVFEALRAAGTEGHWRDHVESNEDDSFGSQLEFEGPPPGRPEQLFHDYRATLIEARLEETGAELRRRLAEAESRGDQETLSRLLEEQRALARDRSELRQRPSTS